MKGWIYGDKKCLTLIDTRCNVSLVYKKVYEYMELENVDRGNCGEMRGIGSLRIPLIAKFHGGIYIAAFRMNKCEFMVVDG